MVAKEHQEASKLTVPKIIITAITILERASALYNGIKLQKKVLGEIATIDNDLDCVRLIWQCRPGNDVQSASSEEFGLISVESLHIVIHMVPKDLRISKKIVRAYKKIEAQPKLGSRQPWEAKRFYMNQFYEF